MFVLCPHCQFLAPRDPASGAAPKRCPRCDGLLPGAATLAPGGSKDASGAAASSVQGGAVNTAGVDGEHPQADAAVAEGALVDEDAAPPGAGPATNPHAPVERDDDSTTDRPPVAASAIGSSSMPPAAATADASVAASEPVPASDEPLATASLRIAGPEFPGSPAPASTRRGRSLQAFAIAALLAMLATQILFADRARLAADARWRPLLQGMCGITGCRLPEWRQPQAFTMLARDVRMHPQRVGALRASATFRNDAPWAQPWPGLRLTLSDADGRTLGMRTFAPEAYLDTSPRGVLAPGQTARIAIDLHEPGPGVVAFAFEFR